MHINLFRYLLDGNYISFINLDSTPNINSVSLTPALDAVSDNITISGQFYFGATSFSSLFVSQLINVSYNNQLLESYSNAVGPWAVHIALGLNKGRWTYIGAISPHLSSFPDSIGIP